jgi:hypothetical protein
MSYNVRNSPKSWKNKNIDFWVPKESEEVLVENRVPTAGRVEKGRV